MGLVSNGEEEGKGTALTLAAYDLLKASDLNFVGNIEGNDIIAGKVDVVVCDGFTGNVILKTMEGTAGAIVDLLRAQLRSSLARQARRGAGHARAAGAGQAPGLRRVRGRAGAGRQRRADQLPWPLEGAGDHPGAAARRPYGQSRIWWGLSGASSPHTSAQPPNPRRWWPNEPLVEVPCIWYAIGVRYMCPPANRCAAQVMSPEPAPRAAESAARAGCQ